MTPTVMAAPSPRQAEGGALVDGTYRLVSVTGYDPDGPGTGCTWIAGAPVRATIEISQASAAGASLHGTSTEDTTCIEPGQPGTATTSYSASAAEIALVQGLPAQAGCRWIQVFARVP